MAPRRRQEQAKKVEQLLNDLLPSPTISLEHFDPFTLLIAVLLSAQCTDERVNRVTRTLFAKAATPEAMVQLSIQEIEQIIHSLGLYKTKAKHIWQLSKILLEHYAGHVPSNIKLLETLPGVGHKTASVVMLHAFCIPAFPVDTHIIRCAQRWKLSDKTTVKGIEEDLKELFPKQNWGRIHLQIILAGRIWCKAIAHNTQTCPICSKL